MWWSRPAPQRVRLEAGAACLLLGLALAGCGFQPLYGRSDRKMARQRNASAFLPMAAALIVAAAQ